MASVEKRGNKWRARAVIGGRLVAAGTWDTRSEALQAALERERMAQAGNTAGAYAKRVRDLLDRYAEQVSSGKRGRRWEVVRLAYMARTDWAALPADRLTPEILGQWRDERLETVAGSTVIRDFTLLSSVFEHARREWKWINHNPLTDVRRPADNKPRKRRLHEGELEKLRVASGYRPDHPPLTAMARTVAAAEFAIETAMRSGEICALTWDHVHARHAHIPDSKTGAARDVPLSPRAQEIIQQMRAAKDAVAGVGDKVFGLDDAQRDALWRKIRSRALIDGLNFHDLRREAASRLAKIFDVLTLAKITGHKDLKLLRDVYYAPTPDELADIMAKRSTTV